MASNNLRVVYNNLVDTTNIVTTLSASSAALPVANLKSDTKSLVWRTATAAAATAFAVGTGSPSLVATIDGKYSIAVSNVSGNNIICSSSIETLLLNQHALFLGKSVVFSGTPTNSTIVVGTVYYIVSISTTTMTISTSPNAATFKVNLMATFSVPTIVGAIIMPFTNLTKTATITVKGYTGTTPLVFPTTGSGVNYPGNIVGLAFCTQVFSVVNSLCAPYSLSGDWSWGSSGTGVNSFSYSGGTYARVYIPLASQIACTSIVIEISDQYNTDKYIEVSRLIIGSYWTPKYNTQYGLTSTINDLTTNERTESGNLSTNRGAKFSTLNFDLGYLSVLDRNNLFSIFRGSGTSKPLFVSLFPEDTDLEKERDFQIYGKLSGINPITHNTLDLYSSALEIQEV